MNTDKIYTYSKRFMERHYEDEAPYFDIAWKIFEEIEEEDSATLDLKGPVVRFEGDDTIMAPTVIRAFYVLFTIIGGEIEFPEDIERLQSKIMDILSKNRFSPEFSTRVVDFVLENPND